MSKKCLELKKKITMLIKKIIARVLRKWAEVVEKMARVAESWPVWSKFGLPPSITCPSLVAFISPRALRSVQTSADHGGAWKRLALSGGTIGSDSDSLKKNTDCFIESFYAFELFSAMFMKTLLIKSSHRHTERHTNRRKGKSKKK